MQFIKTSPDQKLLSEESHDGIPNPMLDSIDSSANSQRKFPFKQLKLTLSSGKGLKKKEIFIQPFQVKSIQQKDRHSTSPFVVKPQTKHKQIDYLFPLLKLAQCKHKANGSECQNGEEVTIGQKFYVQKSIGILEIFQKTAHGYKLAFEEVEQDKCETINADSNYEEQLMKASQARKVFQRATKKIQSFQIVSDALKQVSEEEKKEELRLKQNRQHSEQMNSLLKNQLFKSEHQLSTQIDLAKQNTIRWCIRKIKSTQINNESFNLEEEENQVKITQVNELIKNTKNISITITYGCSILFILFIFAYLKTINNSTTIVEDL